MLLPSTHLPCMNCLGKLLGPALLLCHTLFACSVCLTPGSLPCQLAAYLCAGDDLTALSGSARWLKKKGILSAFFLNKDFCKMELCNVYVGRKEKLVAPPLTTVIAPFLNGILLFSSLHWQLLQVTLYVRCIQTLAPAVHIQKIECTRHEIHFYSFFTVLGICKYSVSCIISFSSDGKELPQGECMSLIFGKGSLGDLQGKVKILLLSIMATVKLFNKKESVIIIPINLCCWWCSLLSFWKGRCKNMHLGEKSSL